MVLQGCGFTGIWLGVQDPFCVLLRVPPNQTGNISDQVLQKISKSCLLAVRSVFQKSSAGALCKALACSVAGWICGPTAPNGQTSFTPPPESRTCSALSSPVYRGSWLLYVPLPSHRSKSRVQAARALQKRLPKLSYHDMVRIVHRNKQASSDCASFLRYGRGPAQDPA